MFKLPRIPESIPSSNHQYQRAFQGIPCFRFLDFKRGLLIGAGGFGNVYHGKFEDKDVVVKQIEDASEKEIMKEARFLHHLQHENLVKFHGMCLPRKALMLEYVEFDLSAFGVNRKLSSLDALLQVLSKGKFIGFEHLTPHIAEGISLGLAYLHKQGVAHRDLKPSNVLVSNQHFLSISDEAEKEVAWKNSPCVAKLTDFGESWGKICQTSQVARTHTSHVFKGTLAFMAPEIIDPVRRPLIMREHELQKADIWSLGMLFFCLLNPGYKAPFYEEAIRNSQTGEKWASFLQAQISKGINPEESQIYEKLQSAEWQQVYEAFQSCIKMDPINRPSVETVLNILKYEEEATNYPLRIHQGSALVQSIGSTFKCPQNDGTNACVFLALKFAEKILSEGVNGDWNKLKTGIEFLIDVFPEVVNPMRNIDETYDAQTAYDIMKNNGMISDFHFVDKSSGKTIYSTMGRQELLEHIKNLSGVSLILVPPYSFLAGKEGEWYYIIDSHVINHTLGGNGNGILKVFRKHSDMAKWIWRRMSLSNVKSETRQQIIRIEMHCPGDTPFNEQSIASRSRHGGSLAMKQQGQQSPASQQPVISEGALVQESASVMQESRLQMQELKPLMHEWGPHRLPYLPSYTQKLKNSEMLALVLSDHRRAARIPQACRKNAVFIIDSLKIENPDDVQSDLNGVFPVCIEIKTYTVNVASESVKVAAKKMLPLGDNQFHLRIHRVQNKSGLVRNISYFKDKQGKILNNSIILQYFMNTKICGDVQEVDFKVAPHGNVTSNKNYPQDNRPPFYPLKKSTLSGIHDGITGNGKRKLSAVYDQAMSGSKDEADFGDLPRSKKQIRDLANIDPQRKRDVPFNEVETLLGYNEELGNEGIIWYHGDIPSDLWVIGTNRMIRDLSHAEGGYPLSTDPTFNHGAFEVTPFTYRHQHIEAKSRNVKDTWMKAVMVGPTVIQHDKTEEAYDTAFRVISRKTQLTKRKIGIITDGEEALIKACENNFAESTGLRCTLHFKSNCKDYLKSMGVTRDSEQAPFLDIVFGETGLIEAEDKHDLKKKLKAASRLVDEIESSCLNPDSDEAYHPKFSTFLWDREKSVLRKLIRDARRKGGMPIDEEGVPRRTYTNQSETVNSMLSTRKQVLGYSKKDDLSKTQFIRNIWEPVVALQDSEIERALYGQSEQYRLTKEAKYLEVDVEQWYNWTDRQRKQYIEEFSKLSIQDVESRKRIEIKETSQTNKDVPVNNLSQKLTDVLPMILYADLLEKKAIALLNTPESIVLSPSVEPQDGNKSYLVASAGGKPRPDFYTVKLSNKTKVVCNCKGYRFAKICSHAVAVAEKNGVLLELVKGVKISHRSALTYPNGSRGHGRKGRCNRRLRTYVATPSSNNNEEDKRPFNKVWHNNEPLIVSFVKEVPIDKNQCGYCGNAFPRDGLAIIPFNIVLSHKERWEYLNRNRSSPSEPKFLKSPPNKTTTRFYCVQKACIYKRFPYFQSNLLKVPDNMLLKDSHKKLIRDELGVEV